MCVDVWFITFLILSQGFSLVIATNLDEKTTMTLSSLLWSTSTPLMLVRSYGLVGYIRLQVLKLKMDRF